MPLDFAAMRTARIGGAQVHLTNVQIGEDVILDEVHLEGSGIRLDAPADGARDGRLAMDETKVRLLMTEPNVNRLLAASLPPASPVRRLQAAILSGRIRFTGQYVKSVMSLPFTVDAAPRIEHGNRITYDFQSAKMGIGLPGTLVEMIENIMNERFAVDLAESPAPIWLDEIRCEPGRITVIGRVRLTWPLAVGALSAPSPEPDPPAALLPPTSTQAISG